MRYITVEDLELHYDNEPVLENIHYHLDSGEFVTLTVKWGSQDDLDQGYPGDSQAQVW